MQYSENDILKLLELPHNKRLGKDRLIQFCKGAGLIIKPVQNTLKGKGSRILYQIIENNYILKDQHWIDCIYNSNYEVSNLGRIRSKKNKRLLGFKDDKGYYKVALGDKYKQIATHRIVYFSFHPQDFVNENIFTIDHIDGCRTNNNINNLQKLTNLENITKMKQDQTNVQSLLGQVVSKIGYQETIKILNQIITRER